MKTNLLQWWAKAAVMGSLLFPVSLSSQMPSLAKLVVTSHPNTGARISFWYDGKERDTGQVTNAVFVVAPGTYRVSLSGSATCPQQDVALATGNTKTLACSNGAWTIQ